MRSTHHVPTAKAARPKKKNYTKKHRAAAKRRLEQELGRPRLVRVKKTEPAT